MRDIFVVYDYLFYLSFMDLLKKLESDHHILTELKELLEFAPPGALRRSLEDLIFHAFMEADNPCLPNQSTLVSHIYYLINFLNEVESSFNTTGNEGGK